jgi:hemerythrin-like metal-binding protein
MPTLSTIHHEHDHIVKMLKELKDHAAAGIPAPKLIAQVAAIIEYAAFHFKEEEEMMKEFNYFDYDGHEETHRVFIKMATALYDTLVEDPTYLSDVIRIFTNWFSTHIDVEMFLFSRAQSRLKHLSTTVKE